MINVEKHCCLNCHYCEGKTNQRGWHKLTGPQRIALGDEHQSDPPVEKVRCSLGEYGARETCPQVLLQNRIGVCRYYTCSPILGQPELCHKHAEMQETLAMSYGNVPLIKLLFFVLAVLIWALVVFH